MNTTKLTTSIIAILIGVVAFAQGTVSTVVDTTAYRFTDDLIFDSNGNLYCADYSGDAVYKMTPNGTVSIFASGMNTPNGLAFDSNGDLFVCDNIGNAIYKLNSAGTFIDTFDVTQPSGIIKDALSDTMIFTTYGNQSTLQKLAPNGTVVNFHAGSPLNGPVGLAYCQNELYVANFTNREIYRVESDSLVFIAQLPGTGSLGFLATVGDNLMATAFNTHKLYSIDPVSQTVSLYSGASAGHVNGSVTNALFTTPNGIVANPTNDTIYVSEYSTRRLRMITDFNLGLTVLPAQTTFNLYPNPVQNTVHIDVEEVQLPYSLRLINSLGETIIEENNITELSQELNLSDFKAGIYVLTIQSNDSQFISEQLIKLE